MDTLFYNSVWSVEANDSWSSDSGSVPPMNFSDEEVLLASTHPKKRAGRKKFKETRHPVYRGVRRRNSGKWTRIWLGTFHTAEMAVRAHDVAAIALRGRAACLNFADSAWRLPVLASGEAKDIQKAALEAAEAFWPVDLEEEAGEIVRKKEEEGKSGAKTTSSEGVFYIDEEAVFGMPGLLTNMAKGMLLPPPHCMNDGYCGDNVEVYADVSLWSHSI
ncbi:hypothetical protein UlMin_024375 [Ulmus minor]